MHSDDEKQDGHVDDYEVGNKKPPKHSRFKPGVSGNPRGRPKGSVNLRTRVTQQLNQNMTVTSNGRPVKMRKNELIARQIVDKAIKGDLKAAMLAIKLDDEASAMISKSWTEDAFGGPDKANLRFIQQRINGLIGEDE